MENENSRNGQIEEQDTDHLMQVRLDKLKELQTAGKDPFQITKYDVTAHSADIKDHYPDLENREARGSRL